MGQYRTSIWEVPSYPVRCSIDECPYNGETGIPFMCGEPRINKGNGDALCHKWSNKRLLEHLGFTFTNGRWNT